MHPLVGNDHWHNGREIAVETFIVGSRQVDPLRAAAAVVVDLEGRAPRTRRAGVSATDLFNATTARSTPAEQSTPPSTTRGIKNADREVDFVFTTNDFLSWLFGFTANAGPDDVLRRKEWPESSGDVRREIISS